MTMARIGVQASTVKTAFAELGPYEAMRRIAEVGYRSVEISQVAMTPENVEEMRRAQEDHGVEVVALSAMLAVPPGITGESLETHLDKIVDDCRTLGTSILRIGMLPFDAMGSREKVLGFAHRAQELGGKLRAQGIDLYYHNHHVEFARFDGRLMLEMIADEAPDVGLELDVHWIQRGGMDPVKVLARYAGRVRLVHLKDYRIGLLPHSALELLAQRDMAAGDMAQFVCDHALHLVRGIRRFDQPGVDIDRLTSGHEGIDRTIVDEHDIDIARREPGCLDQGRRHLLQQGLGFRIAQDRLRLGRSRRKRDGCKQGETTGEQEGGKAHGRMLAHLVLNRN
jgi:sugar phosphate isomerase/epimerase